MYIYDILGLKTLSWVLLKKPIKSLSSFYQPSWFEVPLYTPTLVTIEYVNICMGCQLSPGLIYQTPFNIALEMYTIILKSGVVIDVYPEI